MELTPLDTDLIRLHQTLGELVTMGLVKEIPGQEVSNNRYKIIANAGRPGDGEDDDQEEAAPVRAHAVGAA